MANIFDRLQFARGLNPYREDGVFNNRVDARSYILDKQQPGAYPSSRPALAGEPSVLLYDSGDSSKGPNVMLAIGSIGDGTPNEANRTFFIDTQKTEEEIEELNLRIDEIAQCVGIGLTPVDSNTIDLSIGKTGKEFSISGDVKLADYKVIGNEYKANIIQVEGNKGLYAFVDLEYDNDTSSLNLNVNGTKKSVVTLPTDKYVTAGWYDPREESIFIKLADRSQVKISVSQLINEWDAIDSGTPIILKRTHVSAISEGHEGVYEFQDVLEGDVRIANYISDNILEKSGDGRSLYVKGTADNIIYKDGITVKTALDNNVNNVSTSTGNLIYKRPDGIYATAMLSYNAAENKLIYTYSDGNAGEIKSVDFQLNSAKIIDDISYDPDKEVIEIRYVDAKGDYHKIEIPVGDLIDEWTVNNDGHTIQLTKERSQGQGKDVLSADAKIHNGDNNILETISHELYVKGLASNIKFDEVDQETVKDKIIGLNEKTNTIDSKVESIDEKIGDGFGPRNTVKDEIDRLQTEVNNSLSDLINEDHSINVDKTDASKPVISVNLSEEVEQGKDNIIKLNADGLYAGVDLSYNKDSNKLTFTTTNEVKEIELESVSSIISIEYNAAKEAVIVTYLTNGHDVKTIEIPVGDIINEWRVEDGHPHSIQLEKVRNSSGTTEVDVLKAAVVISEIHNDNILIEDNGALYVPGQQITDNANAIDSLDRRLDVVESDVDTLKNDVDSLEVSVATNAANISSEQSRAMANENYITRLITDEASERRNSDTILQNLINAETTRATEKETILQTAINNEVSRAQTAEDGLSDAINTEKLTARAAENSLSERITTEIFDRTNSYNTLSGAVTNEVSRATASENTITTALANEISRSTAEDSRLNNSIISEIAAREAADAALEDEIRGSILTFDDTASIDLTKAANNTVTADVKIQGGNNIIKCGSGLYATVELSYDTATNRLKLITSDGPQQEIQLVGASLLENLVYDPVEKELVITYKDATGTEHTVSFGVEELFNDWIVSNPSEKSAIELTKSIGGAGEPDILSGRVLITDDRNGDGKPDAGSDNIIEIRNNGLYVNGSSLTASSAIAECVKTELVSVERAVFGNQVIGDCGEGFVYTPPIGTSYISSATNVNNATYILDINLNRLSSYTESINNNVNIVSGTAECLKNELNVTQENVLGMAVPDCGKKGDGTNFEYVPNIGTNYIFSATSFNNSDVILDREIKKTNDTVNIISQKVDIVSGKVECAETTVDAIGDLMFGDAYSIPSCGNGASYPQYNNGCIISGATSLYDADVLLNNAICGLMNQTILSSVTPTNTVSVVEQNNGKKLLVDARLSHGNTNEMSDGELIITNNNGAYIDPNVNEFTRTNVLRIVDMDSLPDDSNYNGIYLSNIWDCGLYYDDVADAAAITAAQAAGYNTNYKTDTTTASPNYMNNVRQNDIQ